MKYPVIIFYRDSKYDYIDKYLIEFKNDFDCTFFITNNEHDLNNLYDSKFHLLLTFGDDKEEYSNKIYSVFTEYFIKERWMHFEIIANIHEFNNQVNAKYIDLVIGKQELYRPVFSIFTTCFNSYEKIIRCYQSILNQTLFDWEWVIIDDSTDDKHFQFLNQNIKDKRVRKYKRSENSGSIGNVKNEAVSLCRGKYVLEMDHDDEIIKELLSDAYDIFDKDGDVGFIYTDFINIYENGNNWIYGGTICKGYGSYYIQKYNNKWVYVYITPNINNITLSALVCCPNHARIWKRSVLLQLGNYSELLYICDDYDILLRTAINTKMVKLHKMGYIQYMNDNENNFSLIRNSEINRIGPNYISKQFYEKYDVNRIMKQNNAYEDERYLHTDLTNIWLRKNYEHKYANTIVNRDYTKQICIIGIESLIIHINYIVENYKNDSIDFILLDNAVDNGVLTHILDLLHFDRMKCYTLSNNTEEEMKRYFIYLYKSCDDFEFIVNDNKFQKRSDIINHYIKSGYEKYLEIGIEYGNTFDNIKSIRKVGVDPDPKTMSKNIIKKTADDFFLENKETFDIIFIDGMHQVEYIINDINNSINCIDVSANRLFIDDIMPLTYGEQLKIPENHCYENGILKYKNSWTGDIWKVVYFILIKHFDKIKHSYSLHSNYRGVMCIEIITFFQISLEEIENINNYSYEKDFKDYILLLNDGGHRPQLLEGSPPPAEQGNTPNGCKDVVNPLLNEESAFGARGQRSEASLGVLRIQELASDGRPTQLLTSRCILYEMVASLPEKFGDSNNNKGWRELLLGFK